MSLRLSTLRKNILVMKALRWDVTPETLFKPRFTGIDKDRELAKETHGYMFYIDYVGGVAKLMLMKTVELTSSTVGEVKDVPQDMLLRAVKAEGVKPMAGMYPIGKELEEWLKSQVGIKD